MDEFDPFHIFNCASDHNGLECPKRTLCIDDRPKLKRYKVNLSTSTNSLFKMVKLHHKYEHLQQLYYSLYLESFYDESFKVENHQVLKFFELHKNFKNICSSLHKVRSNQYLTREEIKVLLKQKDIKKFLTCSENIGF